MSGSAALSAAIRRRGAVTDSSDLLQVSNQNLNQIINERRNVELLIKVIIRILVIPKM